MLIEKETLEAVKKGILSDSELNEAIKHYTILEKLLKEHGDKYFLVWKDVYNILSDLEYYKKLRSEK